MKKCFIGMLFLCIAFVGHAQNKYLDSLKTVLAHISKPVERFDLLNKILEYGYINGESNPDSSSCIQLVSIAQQLNNDSLLAIGYNQVGNYFLRNKGDFSSSLEYFFKGIPLAEAVHDKRRLSSLYIDIAALYSKLNNAVEELKYTRKALANLPEKTSPLYNFMTAQAQYYMCSYFLSQQQNDSALHYAQALNETNLSLKSPIFESAVHGQWGWCMIEWETVLWPSFICPWQIHYLIRSIIYLQSLRASRAILITCLKIIKALKRSNKPGN